MKKLTLLAASVLLSLTGFSQAIPDNGFETWYNEKSTSGHFLIPQHWCISDQLNRLFTPTYTGGAVSQTAVSYSGSYATLFQTVINSGDTVNGALFSADSITSVLADGFGGDVGLGFPDAVRSANLQGYYKYTGVGGDTAVIGVVLTKWNTISNKRDTLVKTEFQTGTNKAAYTLINMPLVYLINTENPDTAFIDAGINGPSGKNSHVGTMFYLDDLTFNGTVPLGINELPEANKLISVYPNPFSTSATLSINAAISPDNNVVEICNMLGQTVRTISNVNSSNITLEKGDLQSGMYFYRLINAGAVISTGKFIIE